MGDRILISTSEKRLDVHARTHWYRANADGTDRELIRSGLTGERALSDGRQLWLRPSEAVLWAHYFDAPHGAEERDALRLVKPYVERLDDAMAPTGEQLHLPADKMLTALTYLAIGSDFALAIDEYGNVFHAPLPDVDRPRSDFDWLLEVRRQR